MADSRARLFTSGLVDNNKVILNGDSLAKVSRVENGVGVGVPDVMFVDVAIADRLSWETINDLISDHLPILISGVLDAIVECDYQAGQRNCTNVISSVFSKCLDEGVAGIFMATSPSCKLV